MRTVSVITPVHPAAADHLGAAYASLAAQVMPPGWEWQWVVQQDGDDPAVSAAIPGDARISYRAGRQRAYGAAVTRTLALSRASGEYVRVLDADDQLTPGALARDIAVLTGDREIGWTTSAVIDLLPDGSTARFPDPPAGAIERRTLFDRWCRADRFLAVHPATLCMRRALLAALGGWMALPASEDTGLLMALNVVSRGWFIPEAGMIYRKWAAQTTADPIHMEPEDRAARCAVIEARCAALLAGMGSLRAGEPPAA